MPNASRSSAQLQFKAISKSLIVIAIPYILGSCSLQPEQTTVPAQIESHPILSTSQTTSLTTAAYVELLPDGNSGPTVLPDRDELAKYEQTRRDSGETSAIMGLPGHAFCAEKGSHATVKERDEQRMAVRIHITDGVCAGKEGWVSSRYLQPAKAPARIERTPVELTNVFKSLIEAEGLLAASIFTDSSDADRPVAGFYVFDGGELEIEFNKGITSLSEREMRKTVNLLHSTWKKVLKPSPPQKATLSCWVPCRVEDTDIHLIVGPDGITARQASQLWREVNHGPSKQARKRYLEEWSKAANRQR